MQRLSIDRDDILERVRLRLGGGKVQRDPRVVWEDQGEALLLRLDTLSMSLKTGWLLCQITAEAGEGTQLLQLVYFLGKDGDADGSAAAATIHVTSPAAAAIADRWGADLQRVVWDGVLDVIEGAVTHASNQRRGQPVALEGFTCSERALLVDIAEGN